MRTPGLAWCAGLLRQPRRLLGTLLIALGIGLAAGEAGVQTWVAYHFRAAQRDLDHRRSGEARAHLRRCLEWPGSLCLWPSSGRVHFLAGRAARLDGDPEDAERHLTAAERLQGVTEANALEWAMLHVQNGDLDPAAASPDPEGAGGYEKALYEQVQKGHPDSALMMEATAEGNLRMYRFQQAMGCIQDWLERQPDNPRALYWRGRAWQRVGAYEKAVPDYRRAVELAPDDDEARLRYANALSETSRFQDALDQLAILRQHRPDEPDLQVRQATALLGLGRAAEARAVLDPAVAAHPDYAPGLTAEGELALQERRFDDAEQWLTHSLARNSHDRPANYAYYLCLQQSGQESAAQKQLARLKQIEQWIDRLQVINNREMGRRPRDPALHCEVGTILRGLGDEDMAANWFQSALALDPNNGPARAALAEYQERHGNSRPR